ncbi:MAG: hypothetical protein AAFN80_09300 [Pseudomonadota bacterium]
MKATKTISLIAALAFLSGCMQSVESETPAPKEFTPPAAKVKKNDVVFNYSANGRTYRLHTRYDGILRAHGMEMTVVAGPAFAGGPEEDAEAQNTIRDAFRAQGICKEGLHPGILALNYGYVPERRSWIAKVRCSEKKQANI